MFYLIQAAKLFFNPSENVFLTGAYFFKLVVFCYRHSPPAEKSPFLLSVSDKTLAKNSI